jgi:hypothetical protein
MQLQHVNVKLLVQNGDGTNLEPLIPVFHGWIESQSAKDELLIDVADYTHVPAGPGIVLIGYEGNYSLDNTGNRLGVRYNRKAAVDGSNQDRLSQAARAALTACQRLETEPRLDGKFRFNGQDIEIFVNDRLIAPNTPATREAFDVDLQLFSRKLFRGKEYSISYGEDPRGLFSAFVKTAQPVSVADLLEALA